MENSVQEIIEVEPTVETKQEEAKPVAVNNKEKRSSKDEKSRKKDDKSIEQILRSLNGLNTPEEKLSAVCRKYNDVVDENRKLQMTVKQMEKKIVMIQREKEQCQSDKSKAVLAKSRLESLCRELQRQNKAVKEESLLKIREEEEKRKEVSAKFQSTLTEITALMAETNDKNVKLHEDNIEIHKKFKSVFDEMDIREQHFESMHQVMKQELKVADAKLAKVTLEMAEERENLLKEKNLLLLKLTEYQSKIKDLQAVEQNLRSQVDMYTEKYDEFQNALSKSNAIFGGFNAEMEKMSKKILKLEKETNMWRTRCEKSNATLLEMATDRQTRDAEIVQLNKKTSLLQELCKAFQQERATLLVQLKEKTSDPLQTDGSQLIENIGGESLENTIVDEIQVAKTEETCPVKQVDASNDKKEEITNLGTDSKEEADKQENESKTGATEIVNSENEANLVETPLVAEVTPPVADNKVVEEEIVNKTDAKEVPIEIKNSSETQESNSEEALKSLDAVNGTIEIKNSSKTQESNSEQAAKSLDAVNGTEVSKVVDTEKTTEVLLADETLKNTVDTSVVPNVEKNHTENSDALISNGDVQNSACDKKPKDKKKKK